MPKFNADPKGAVPSTFTFSTVDMSTLGASEYTLVQLTVDCSGSVSSFAREMEKAVQATVEACHSSPRADNLMLRYNRFDDSLVEVHGFKLLQDCNPVDYDNTIPPGGMTALFDATIDGTDALARYGRELQKKPNNFTANGILIVVTDGGNNAGLNRSPSSVKAAFDKARQGENLESLVTILVGVNVADAGLKSLLETFSKEAGFTQYVNLEDASKKTLARLAAFISKSISSQSQSLGSGGPSQALTF